MTTIALSPLILLILILAIGVTVGIAARRARVVRPDHHHWLVRILCAVLALAALVAVGVGTWRETGANPPAKPVLVTLPTAARPPLPEAADPNGEFDIGPAKLIGTVMLVRKMQDHYLPICGESQTLDWPPRASDELVFKGESGDSSYKISMPLRRFTKWGGGDEIRELSGVRVETRGKRWSSSGGTTLQLDTPELERFGRISDELHHAPLSLIPAVAGDERYLLVHLTRAAPNDPLRQVSASEWLDGEAMTLQPDEHDSRSSSGRRLDPSIPPGFQMLVFLGPAVVLLLLAAITGSALFPRGRRELGFAALMACMVLYAGLLDGLTMQRRARLATDASEPQSTRLDALENIRNGTYFHTGAAKKKLRQIAADMANPAIVRYLAEDLAAQ